MVKLLDLNSRMKDFHDIPKNMALFNASFGMKKTSPMENLLGKIKTNTSAGKFYGYLVSCE
jgi:hypothetical protein